MLEPLLPTFRIYEHQDLSGIFIENICRLKDIFWPNGLDDQVLWWHKNSSISDKYCIGFSGENIIAFLRLHSRKVTIDHDLYSALCFTEVCLDPSYHAQGYGKKLINAALIYFQQSKLELAYLLCNTPQQPFYISSGFQPFLGQVIIESDAGSIRHLNDTESCMIINDRNSSDLVLKLYGNVF